MTAVQQQVAVSEGLAVGCLNLGVAAVTSQKMPVEFAFQRVRRGWAWSSTFPSVHASLPRNEFLAIVHRSQNRRGPIRAADLALVQHRPRRDHIYVLAHGRIIEHGSHDQLIAAEGVYAELFRLQAAAYLDIPTSLAPSESAAQPDGRVTDTVSTI